MPHTLEYQPSTRKHARTPLKALNLGVVLLALLAYLAIFGSIVGVGAIVFFFPFTMLPFAVNAVLLFCWRTVIAQSLVLIASLAYAAWFAVVFVDVIYLHPDPQGAIAFLFVGALAGPALLILWFVADVLEHRRRPA